MSLNATKNQPGQAADPKARAEEAFDRETYFREIRDGFLNRLGLPSGTKPEQVLKIMEIKFELDKIKNKNRH
jgi:hypothetical protein